MTEVTDNDLWGFHINDSIYSLTCPPCPKWVKAFDQQSWCKFGVVVWNAQIQRVVHMFGSQVVRILEESRKSKIWKKEGILVGEIVYRIVMQDDKKSKNKTSKQAEPDVLQRDGWCLANTIQLPPSQARQFLSFLEENKTTLEKVVIKEAEERKRILGEVYSLILSWRRERKKGKEKKTRVPSHLVSRQKQNPFQKVELPFRNANISLLPKWRKSVE